MQRRFGHIAVATAVAAVFSVALAGPALAQSISVWDYLVERALRPIDQERLREGWLGVWILVLIGVQAASVAFAFWRWGARATLLGLGALFAFVGLVGDGLGLPMLDGYLSLLHLVFWTPALIVLLRELATTTRLRSAYGIWSVAAVAVIGASFVVDLPDGLIYLHHVVTT